MDKKGRMRVCLVIVASLLLAALWLFWIHYSSPGSKTGNEEFVDEEYEDVDFDYTELCSQLSAPLNSHVYWACLEENAFYLKNPTKLDSDFNVVHERIEKGNGLNWGLRVPPQVRNPNYEGNKTKKKRSKRSIKGKGPYNPLENWNLNSTSYAPHNPFDFPPNTSNDPFFKYSQYLYTYDGDNLAQKQPPWSYHGELEQNNWNNLEIAKFFLPINPQIGPEKKLSTLLKASLHDHKSEKEWININSTYRFLFQDFVDSPFIFGNEIPKYVQSLDPKNPNKDRSLIGNDPNLGYYSADRFLLPPPTSFKDLKDYKKKNLLPPDFKIPKSPMNEDYVGFANNMLTLIHDLVKGKFDQDPNYKNSVVKNLFIWIDKLKIHFTKNPQDAIDFNVTISDIESTFQGIINVTNKMEIQKPTKTDLLKDRSQLSLPLLPHPYPICQQQEPSPLDIQEKHSDISSIRPYKFDDNVYKMYRARMFFPPDGTNILGVTLEDSDRLIDRGIGMTGGATGGVKLYFDIMFIHVGKTPTTGTEHKMNGKSYAMELQFLFTYRGRDRDDQQEYFKTLARQQNDLFPFRGKVALMLAVMVEVKPDKDVQNKFLFEPLTQLAYNFRKQEEEDRNNKKRSRAFTTRQHVFRLSDYIPTDAQFYTYRGGLTFPPCFGYIYWSVYNTTLTIAQSQFEEFQLIPTVGGDDSEYLAGNIREIDSQWVPNENVKGITTAEKTRLQQIRNSRTVLKSLDIKSYNLTENESHYDYFYDYDKASNQFTSNILILTSAFILLFYI